MRKVTTRCETCNIAVETVETKPTASTQGLVRVVGSEMGTEFTKSKPNISAGSRSVQCGDLVTGPAVKRLRKGGSSKTKT